jgi:S-adenosylmethionine:tRNA ribosyltransferase-isomerase
MTVVARAAPTTKFALPPGRDATAPAERRGLARDGVRLLVGQPGRITHSRFHQLPDHLAAGDLLVVNISATLPAALVVHRKAEPHALVHFSTELEDGDWVIEPRRSDNRGPAGDVRVGERIGLAGGTRLTVVDSYPSARVRDSRLWRARPDRKVNVVEHLLDHGQPIRYGYVDRQWPISDLQNVYSDPPGSAEMPSAGRPFTERLLVRLVARGIRIAPVVLHTGVSSPEKHEAPSPERYVVPPATAELVNQTRAAGRRVVAVGTTVVRALETVANTVGVVAAASGWTELVLGPDRPSRCVSGLITGLHEPEASHLLLLEAVAGSALVTQAYEAAVARDYLWHEFGDSMLFLP